MLISFALLAALAVSADGAGATTKIASPTHTERRAQASFAETSQKNEEVVVRSVSEQEFSVSTTWGGTSNAENGESASASTFTAEDEGVSGCDDCGCCRGSNPHGNLGCLHRFHPSHRHSPGNMPQHFPYVAEPKNYYYFRPYNWFHILDQQREVTLYGGDPRHPYANDLFQEIYGEIEAESDSTAAGS